MNNSQGNGEASAEIESQKMKEFGNGVDTISDGTGGPSRKDCPARSRSRLDRPLGDKVLHLEDVVSTCYGPVCFRRYPRMNESIDIEKVEPYECITCNLIL